MQRKRLLLAASSGISAFFIAASAHALEMSAPDGWYLEGNVGAGHLSNVDYQGASDRTGLAYNVNVGYKIIPYAAIEGGWTKYDDSKIQIDGIKVANVSHYSFDLAAKGILPFSCAGIEAFGKLGAAYLRAKATNEHTDIFDGDFASSASSAGLFAGAGVQFNVMSELAVVVQWQHVQGNHTTGNMDLYSVGINFIFV